VGIGIGIAAVIIVIDSLLFRFKMPFRIPVLAAALGMYLPFELAGPIVLGGVVMRLAQYILQKLNVPSAYVEVCQRNGLLFAAGLITGEAVVGILLAFPIVFVGKDFMALSDQSLQWPGIVLLAFTMGMLLCVVVGKPVYYGRGDGGYMVL